MKTKMYASLRREIEDIRVVDCHEHITYEEKTRDREMDLFSLFKGSYAFVDLLSAGVPTEIYLKPPDDPEERHRLLARFLPKIKGTAYYRCMLTVCQDLFDLEGDEIHEGNQRELSDRINSYCKRPDWYRYVLKDRARMELALHGDETGDVDFNYYRPIMPVQHWMFAKAIPEEALKRAAADPAIPFAERMRIPTSVFGMSPAEAQRKEFEQRFGVPEGFDDFLTRLDAEMERRKRTGSVGIKIAIAYFRALRFERVSRNDAERIFNKPDDERTPLEFVALQDHIAHHIVRRCGDLSLVVQIHTGIQAGTGNYLEKSNPLHLTNLFFDYPEVKFDVFHGGYPYCGEIGVLAKSFPNVYLDFCWMPIISPSAVRRHLREWIETVPGFKLLWGGDALTPEEGYGAIVFARDSVAAALADAVDDGYFSRRTATEFARMILRENALELFQIDPNQTTLPPAG